MTALSVGVDLVEIRRVQAMIERFGNEVLRRLLTESEFAYCTGRPKVAQHAAGRIAAKEATYKALQVAGDAAAVNWLEIEVVNEGDGRPRIAFHGRALAAARRLGVAETLISISHSVDTAIAMIILTGTPTS